MLSDLEATPMGTVPLMVQFKRRQAIIARCGCGRLYRRIASKGHGVGIAMEPRKCRCWLAGYRCMTVRRGAHRPPHLDVASRIRAHPRVPRSNLAAMILAVLAVWCAVLIAALMVVVMMMMRLPR